uniref:Uncharacterized protein n=1 Tax=Rhizophora mucronata TaxID=61149 RepID=A0A2P2II90_RHIMU
MRKVYLCHYFLEFSTSNKDKIWYYDYCFGHSLFSIFKIMFLLFKKINVNSFHCLEEPS